MSALGNAKPHIKTRVDHGRLFWDVTYRGQIRTIDFGWTSRDRIWEKLRWHVLGWVSDPLEQGYCNGIDYG